MKDQTKPKDYSTGVAGKAYRQKVVEQAIKDLAITDKKISKITKDFFKPPIPSSLDMFQKAVQDSLKPTQQFLDAIETISASPVNKIVTEAMKPNKMIAELISQQTLANKILKQEAMVTKRYVMPKFEFETTDHLEAILKPAREKYVNDIRTMDSIPDRLDRVEEKVTQLTSLLAKIVPEGEQLLSDSKVKYTVEKIETTRPSERKLKINDTEIKFINNAKMGELLELVIRKAEQYEGEVPDDEIITELFGIEIYDVVDKDKIKKLRHKLKRLVENLNNKVGYKTPIKKIVQYSKQTLKLTIYQKKP